MADLSGYTPIYIRTTGNDTTGDGSSGTPYATAQKGFDIAAATESGNYVLDFGAGSFGGVILDQDWPSRIAVRGVSATESLLGGIETDRVDMIYDYENYFPIVEPSTGRSIALVSNETVNVGDITTTGGNGVTDAPSAGGNGGTVSLEDCVCGDINSRGGFGTFSTGSAGAVTLAGCVAGDVLATGGNGPESGPRQGGNGGATSLTDTVCLSITTTAATGYGSAFPVSGSVTLLRSSSGQINALGADTPPDAFEPSVAGPSVQLTDSNATGINVSGGLDYYGTRATGGTITLSGSGTIPATLTGPSSVDSSGLRQGRGVNGSSILGLQ